VIVTDFGHGSIDQNRIEELCRESDFLAVAAQTNSANMGFNLITKYRRGDYVVIDEPEARLAAADRDGHIEDVIHKLAFGRYNKFVVTLGHNGAYGYENGFFYRQKAFTDLVRDTMGAGDAFFSVTAPMAKTGRMEDLLFIGCAAGALKCQIVGHRDSITKEKLCGFIRAHQNK
jgi:sugar/nucleoside kinase (ribokinase family)